MLANPLFINNEVKLDCEFSIYKSRSFISPSVNLLFVKNGFCRVAGQLIYDSPERQNCNLFHGNGGNS